MDNSAFKDPALAKSLVATIEALAPDHDVNFMEVCGTHTVAIARNGIRNVMPEQIHLISGPGCPVCVTSNHDIDTVIALSRVPGIIITTFGDMIRVPGSTSSLLAEKANGADVRIVYSPLDALEVARKEPDRQVAFIGVGFETTAPLIASCIKRADAEGLANFSVFSAHKNVPAALRTLVLDPAVAIDAFILPGHVSTIIGARPYEFLADEYHIPGVITGFEPLDVLEGLAMITRQLHEGRAGIEIAYKRGVAYEGNQVACALIDEVFEKCDATWRGIGVIDGSGFALRPEFATFDALRRFDLEVEPTIEPKGCRCGDVLRGIMPPDKCPLFDTACTPEHPVGPCMVSSEGSCAAYWRYRSA